MEEYSACRKMMLDIIEKANPENENHEIHLRLLTLISIISLSILHKIISDYNNSNDGICLIDFHECTKNVLSNVLDSIDLNNDFNKENIKFNFSKITLPNCS